MRACRITAIGPTGRSEDLLFAGNPPGRTVPMVRRLLLLTAGLLTVVLSSLWWLRADDTDRGDYYIDRIVDCGELVKNEESVEEAYRPGEDCMSAVFVLAYQANDLGQLLGAVDSVISTDRRLYLLCHPAAHDAARQALELAGPSAVTTLLDTVAVNTACDWGFGHGVLDAVSELGDDTSIAQNVVRWCDLHHADLRLYDLCADGVGHYAWSSTKDFAKSVRMCASLGHESGKQACGGGIMMQLFEPARADGTYSLEDAPRLIPELCSRWAALVPDPSDYSGCGHGAGYIYGLDVRDASWAWLNAPESQTATSPTPEAAQAVMRAFSGAQEKCSQLPANSDLCVNMVARSMPLQWGQRFPDSLDEICRALENEHARSECVNRRNIEEI